MRRAKSTLLPGKTLRRRLFRVGTGVLLALDILAVVVWFEWPREEPTLADILSKTGYFELMPPSTFSGPGTINTVEYRSDGSLALYPTCDMPPKLLSNRTLTSQTVDHELTQSLDERFNVSGQVKKILEAVVGLNRIKSVHIKLENTNLFLVTGETLINARNALLKGSCQEAVIENISNGATVCQTSAVLKADFSYDIEYNDNVTIDEQARLNSAVEVKLNAHQASANRITGHQLIFGVRLSPSPILPKASSDAAEKCGRFLRERS